MSQLLDMMTTVTTSCEIVRFLFVSQASLNLFMLHASDVAFKDSGQSNAPIHITRSQKHSFRYATPPNIKKM